MNRTSTRKSSETTIPFTAPQIMPKTFLTTEKYNLYIDFQMLKNQKDLNEIEWKKKPTYNKECLMQQLPQVIEELFSRPITREQLEIRETGPELQKCYGRNHNKLIQIERKSTWNKIIRSVHTKKCQFLDRKSQSNQDTIANKRFFFKISRKSKLLVGPSFDNASPSSFTYKITFPASGRSNLGTSLGYIFEILFYILFILILIIFIKKY